MERLVQLARQAFKEMSEQQELLESKVMLERQEPRARLVFLEQTEPRERQDRRGQQGYLDLMERLVLRE
jgi:hypothetical protein